tara:strand:- start:942 stop:1442 length:501 start_codon:yes stop_codon:yes gene_type:complete
MVHRWSVWLIPDEADRLELGKLIEDCTNLLNSPTFDPHVTLFGRLDLDIEYTLSFFKNFAKRSNAISLKTLGVNTGKPPWKTLYLQMETKRILIQLQNQIDQYLNQYRTYEFDPHLTLAYGNMKIRDIELEDISFPESITFSSVALVKTPDEISSWQQLELFRLGE